MDSSLLENIKQEISYTEESNSFCNPDVCFDGLIAIRCGIIFICSDSNYYINCIVDNCSFNKNFYQINSFIDHVKRNHENCSSNISNKIEPTESIEPFEPQEQKIDNLEKRYCENENEINITKKCNKNSLDKKLNVKTHQCHICNKNFSKIIYLEKHLKRHSTKSTSISCNDGKKKIQNTANLRLHMSIDNTTSSDNRESKQISIEPTTIAEDHVSNLIIDSKKPIVNENAKHFLENDEAPSNKNVKLTRTCHICHKTFQSRKYLRRHILLHSNIKPVKVIPCTKCNKIFKYEHHLRFHMVVHDVEHKCMDCNKIFSNKSSLQRHVVSHLKEKPFKCELCCSKFSLKENLQRHITKIHENKIYGCTNCENHFCNKSQLKAHKVNVHQIHLIEESKLGSSDYIKKQIIHKCDICSKIFTSSRILKRHIRTHNKKSEDPIPCPKCKKTFKYEHHLKMHIAAHDKIHKCSECDKIYAKRSALVNHMQCHSGEKQFKCEFCNTRCFTKFQLKRHFIDAHSEKKHECEHCGKKFRKKHVLTGHIRTHTKEKPLVCEICGISFFTQFLLNNHIKRHNNQRDFKCIFEGCNKTFFTRLALVDHEVTHTKLKPFFCTVEGCNSRFTLRSGLVKHKKLHSNVKNYICKICGKAYAQSPGLYAHMKTHGQPLPSA